MKTGRQLLSIISLFIGLPLAAAVTPRTSLGMEPGQWPRPDKPYAILKRGDVSITVVNNEAVDNEDLPGHRAGYSGIGRIRHRNRDSNLFVPAFSGLNYEHIHDGTPQERKVLFEPRNWPMELRRIDRHSIDLYQSPTPNFKLESCLRYELLEDGVIQMTLECIPRAKTFTNGYIGLFWASYIHQPDSLDIHFPGWEGIGDKSIPQLPKPGMVRGMTPNHGILPTHIGLKDYRRFRHDPKFPLTLVFNKSRHRYSEPWYYGVSHGMGFAQVFREKDSIRLTQSPSGGGRGNPAWDFQYFIPGYKVGQRYQMVMRAIYHPMEPKAEFLKTVRQQYLALQKIR
jgi:hypothetical protein